MAQDNTISFVHCSRHERPDDPPLGTRTGPQPFTPGRRQGEPVGSGRDDDANENHDHRGAASRIDYYQKGRKLGAGRFIGTPDEVIKVTLEAALQAGPADHMPQHWIR
jgi:hypothetical protein